MNARWSAIQRGIFIILIATALGFGEAHPAVSQRAQRGPGDPLPSWNDGAAKRGIIDFVTRYSFLCGQFSEENYQ